MRLMPVAATAPPMIGPHVSADCEDAIGIAPGASESDIAASYRMKRTRRMTIGSGIPSSQRRMPRPMTINSSRNFDFLRISNAEA